MADQLFKKRKEARQIRKSKAIKERSESWLIVCEGTKTEPNYVNSIIQYANRITEESKLKADVIGVGRNTETLVECVDDYFDYVDKFGAQKKGIPYAKTFVLFDKDSFRPQQFNNAIEMAKVRGYIPIWSNECFELWYILHYCNYCSDNGRNAYFKKLTELLGDKYDKASDIFELIHSPERLKQAMNYAQRLDIESSCKSSPAKRVPCTQMYKLIQEIQAKLKVDLLSN